jgi:hypothetical protein
MSQIIYASLHDFQASFFTDQMVYQLNTGDAVIASYVVLSWPDASLSMRGPK